MDKKIKYVIVQNVFFDRYGKQGDKYYTIKYKKRFLYFFNYWKYITHLEGGMCVSYNSYTTWKTAEECKKFIKNILCSNKIYGNWKRTPIFTTTCK